MDTVKYIRTSMIAQNTERQETNASQFKKLYIDKCSGSIKLADRPQGKKLISDVENNLVKVVHLQSIDRLGRDILDILTVVKFLNEHLVNLFVENIGMYSLVNGKPNPSFSMVISVLGNVAEMERNNMLERQQQGILIAKTKGVYKGRLPGAKMTKEDILAKYDKVVRELKNGESLRRTAALCGCSLGTVQKIKALILEEASKCVSNAF
jgi:DNA invertase Pin-like site-specific DNA recombinase